MKKICFAISVHENKEVIKDLLNNIRTFCPNSSIVLFRSGNDRSLCEGLGYPVCPTSKSLSWGKNIILFHLNIMEWLEEIDYDYDYLTIIDSDALFVKKGFEEFIISEMENFDYMAPFRRFPEIDWYPGGIMIKEWTKWQKIFNINYFLACFNPGQTFSKKFVQQIINFPNFYLIKKIINESKTWVFEEIFFPTIAETLGIKAKPYPSNVQKWIRFRPYFTEEEIKKAIETDEACFFIHPIYRDMNDKARVYVRNLL